VTRHAPPGEPGAPGAAGGTLGVAALGGGIAFVALVAACQVLALVQSLLVGVFGLWSWAKIGLLTAVLSLRAEVVARFGDLPGLRGQPGGPSLRWRLPPMLLTIGFLWLAARAGRRAAGARAGRSPLATSALAAVGAAVPVAGLSALAASAITLSFPGIGMTLEVDVARAALWGGVVAAAGAGAGASLEAARERLPRAALRGGLIGYGWALGLAVLGVLVVVTLEPNALRAYLQGLDRLGAGGGVFAGYHVLALPTQSALLLVPGTLSCLDFLVGGEGALRLCPWAFIGSGRVGRALFAGEASELSPWLWLLNVVPVAAAGLGARAAAVGTGGREAVARGMSAGALFGGLAIAGAVFAAPRFAVPASAGWVPFEVAPRMPGAVAAAVAWGIAGGAVGGWLAARRYGEPEPSPTSA
jgi:hypothetical protein